MRLRRVTSIISIVNDYSLLKWPLVIVSILITILSFILLLSFQSTVWFTYDTYDIIEKSMPSNHSIEYARPLEYGSFGLWKLCVRHNFDLIIKCDTWTRRTRPEVFNVVLVLISCALFLINLTIFPSWIVTILIFYNINERYINHIVAFLWILLCLSLISTMLLIYVMILIGISKYYSPGTYSIDTRYISFQTGPGITLILIGTILSIICLFLIITSLIWKRFIEMKLIEEDKKLYRQLTNDSYSSSYHRIIRIPRNETIDDDNFDKQPRYN